MEFLQKLFYSWIEFIFSTFEIDSRHSFDETLTRFHSGAHRVGCVSTQKNFLCLATEWSLSGPDCGGRERSIKMGKSSPMRRLNIPNDLFAKPFFSRTLPSPPIDLLQILFYSIFSDSGRDFHHNSSRTFNADSAETRYLGPLCVFKRSFCWVYKTERERETRNVTRAEAQGRNPRRMDGLMEGEKSTNSNVWSKLINTHLDGQQKQKSGGEEDRIQSPSFSHFQRIDGAIN